MTEIDSIKTAVQNAITGIRGSSGCPEMVDDTSDLIGSGVLDSFGLLTLVSELEERFSIRFDDEELLSDRFTTISGIVDIIRGKCQ